MYFLKNLIIVNPIKTITLSCIFILSYIIQSVPTTIVEVTSPIDTSFEYKGHYCYILSSNNELKMYDYTSPPKIDSKRRIVSNSDNPWIFISGVIIFIMIVFSIVGSFADGGWCLAEVKVKTLLRKVVLDKEDGYYYYSVNGKLLCKLTHKADLWTIQSSLYKYVESSPNLYEDYESVQRTRERKLDKLV